MSLLQRTEINQKADHKHPASRQSGRRSVQLLRFGTGPKPAEYVDSEKWCGDERTKYAVVKVEAISFVLAVICVTLALVLVSIMFPDQWSLIGP
jgi:hypothetical protein